MKEFFRGIALALLFAISGPVLAAEKGSSAKGFDRPAYEAALNKVRAGDLSVDFKWLRQQNAERTGPLGDRWEGGRGAFEKLGTDPAAALAAARTRLEYNYFTPEAHLLAEIALGRLGRKDEASARHAFLKAFFDSVTNGKRDGHTPATAWNATSVGEEYLVLSLLQLKPVRQALINGKDGIFDLMTVEDEEPGKTEEIYFDISSFFGKVLD